MITGNEPAMPFEFQEEYGDYGKTMQRVFKGLTKREQFAAMAMAGLISKYSLNFPKDQQIVCQMAVELADSLITELNKI